MSIINEKPLGSSFQSTYGGIIQPFGVNKIKILELINLSMKIKCPLTLIETLKKLNIFELLIVLLLF